MELIPGEDYYTEDGFVVMTAAYHIKRGHCCGSGCRWCPFEPKHQVGATALSANSDYLIRESSRPDQRTPPKSGID